MKETLGALLAFTAILIFPFLLASIGLWILSLLFGFVFTWTLALKVWVTVTIIKIFM